MKGPAYRIFPGFQLSNGKLGLRSGSGTGLGPKGNWECWGMYVLLSCEQKGWKLRLRRPLAFYLKDGLGAYVELGATYLTQLAGVVNMNAILS